MRNQMLRMLAAFVVVLLMRVALAGSSEDLAAKNNALMARNVAKFAPVDVLEGRLKNGYVFHQDISINMSGEGVIIASTAAREEPWKDAIGRPSNEISRLWDLQKNPWILVKLTTPKSPKGGDERWAREDRAISTKTFPVKFEYRGRVYDTLPNEFVRKSEHTVLDLPTKEFAWVSAGALKFNGRKGLLPNQEPVFKDQFSDRFGGAWLMRHGPEGLELYGKAADTKRDDGHIVTLLYAQEPQPMDSPSLFDPTQYCEVNWFVEDGRSSFLPSRLSGERGMENYAWKFREGTKVWFSVRYLCITMWGDEWRYTQSQEVLVKFEPFADEYGSAVCLTMGYVDDSRALEGKWESDPHISWVWRPLETNPSPDEFNAPVLSASVVSSNR